MGSAAVILQEQDLSTRIPSFPGVYGAIVIPATKGPVDKAYLMTSDTQLLETYTENSKVEVGDSSAFYSALSHLQKSDKLWVKRVVKDALYGGAIVKSASSAYDNFQLPVGMSDPTAWSWDSLPDVEAVSEVFSVQCVADVAGSLNNKYFYCSSLTDLYYVWYNVDAGGTDPAPGGGASPVEVAISSGATAAAVAAATKSQLDLVVGTPFTTLIDTDTLTITVVDAGSADDAVDFNTSFTIGVTTQGVDEVTSADEALIVYQADPGDWGNRVAFKLYNYTTSPDKVKEPGAFLIEVYKTSNLNKVLESHICSRVPGAKDGYGNNIFVEEKLLQSSYIRAMSNPSISSSILPKEQTVAMALAGGNDGSAVTDTEMIAGLDSISNKDEIQVTVIMDGGWATPAFQQAIDTVCKTRLDCVTVFSVPYSAEASASYLNDIIDYKDTDLNIDSSYAALYTPHVKIYDRYNDRQIYVSPDGYASAAISFTAANYEIWFPPAGFRRGNVSVLDLRRRFTKGEMDALYDAGINPLRFVPGRGIYIWGQKTLSSRPSALDRLNVRLMLIVVEPAVSLALEDFLFEINDEATRAIVEANISGYMDDIKARRGVYDYRVVCNDTNNTPTIIDQNKMIVWLFLKPTKSAEEIPFIVAITSTGISFELASQLL